jgi:hypothetical protein
MYKMSEEEKKGEEEKEGEEVIYDVAETQELTHLDQFKIIVGSLYNGYKSRPPLPLKDYRDNYTYNTAQDLFQKEYKTFIKSINPENIKQMGNDELIALIDKVIKKIIYIVNNTSSTERSKDFQMTKNLLEQLLAKIQSSSGGKPKSKRNKSKRKRNKRKRNKSKRKRNK